MRRTDLMMFGALGVMPARAGEWPAALLAAATLPSGEVAWHSPAVMLEGVDTSDGRFIDPGALDWRDLPIPLLSSHTGETADVVGRIDTLDRRPAFDGIGTRIAGAGTFADAQAARDVAQLVADRNVTGISGDVAPDVVDTEYDDEGFPTRSILRSGTMMGASVVPMPAFANAEIHIGTEADCPMCNAVTAAAPPIEPPVEWFDNPAFDEPQRHTTITDDGRIYGHLAVWNECHIGHDRRCILAPHAQGNGYGYFTTGLVRCATDCEIPVGQITLVGGHAPMTANHREAVQHYDDTQSAVADVAIGEDAYGIWFAGALRPGTTPEQVRTFRASAVSGDWRAIGGHLELVAIMACNVPGFPKMRTLAASGEVVALVASADRGRDLGPIREARDALVAAIDARVARMERSLAMIDDDVRAAARARIGSPVTD